MRLNSDQVARGWTFPLIAGLQLGSVLLVVVYVLFAGPTHNDVQVELELLVLPLTPLLWLALSAVGVAALVVRRRGRARVVADVSTWVSGICGLLGTALLVYMMLLASSYGAHFGFPSAPPTPAFAVVIAHADGSDSDDPMRGRETVIDIGVHSEAELVAFYREQFPETEGWVDGSREPDDFGLCLVNTGESDYDEYVEVYRHGGGSGSGDTGRYLVSVSRLFVSDDWDSRTTDRCGLAGMWFPSNI